MELFYVEGFYMELLSCQAGNSNMRPWELLLRNVNVLHSVLEKAEPELSLLELDTKRLFILCMVDANAFPADLARVLSMPKPSMTFLIKKLEESGYLRRQGEKGDLRRYPAYDHACRYKSQRQRGRSG